MTPSFFTLQYCLPLGTKSSGKRKDNRRSIQVGRLAPVLHPVLLLLGNDSVLFETMARTMTPLGIVKGWKSCPHIERWSQILWRGQGNESGDGSVQQ